MLRNKVSPPLREYNAELFCVFRFDDLFRQMTKKDKEHFKGRVEKKSRKKSGEPNSIFEEKKGFSVTT